MLSELSGDLPIGPHVRRVRLEIQDGTVGVDVTEARNVHFGGGVRRAADTAEDLAVLAAVDTDLKAETDPADPTTMIVRGPTLDAANAKGILAYELGLRLPPELDLEIVVANNGYVTVVNRKGALRVSTGRGDLRFEHCTGGTKAHTGRGNVIAFGLGGRVDIETMTGEMQVFVPAPGDLLRLRTGQGTIQCYIPQETGFVCNARAEVGRVGGSFGLHVEGTTGYGSAMTGTQGDGRTKIVLSTGSGYVTLQKHNK